jgi:hypothetical protein
VLFSVAASIITPQEPAICTAPAETEVVVVQLAASVQLAPVPGATVLTRLPAALAGADNTTEAVPPPAARPAGIAQVTVLPVSAPQVAPVGVTVKLPRPLEGSVSVSVIAPVDGPVPLLVAVSVQLMVSPTKAEVLLTLLVTLTSGIAAAATAVLVVQVAVDAQEAPVPGATVLTRLPTALAGAAMTIVAVPLVAASPVGIVQLKVLPETALQVAPVGVTVTAPMPLAGSVSVSVIGAVVGPPVLTAVRVQWTVLPVEVVAVSTLALTVTFGGIGRALTAVVVLQSAVDEQPCTPAPEASTELASVPTAKVVAETTTVAELPGVAPAAMVQVSVLTAGPHDAPLATTEIALTFVGRLASSVVVPAVAPLPLLVAVTVQVTRSPTSTAPLSTVSETMILDARATCVPLELPSSPPPQPYNRLGNIAMAIAFLMKFLMLVSCIDLVFEVLGVQWIDIGALAAGKSTKAWLQS